MPISTEQQQGSRTRGDLQPAALYACSYKGEKPKKVIHCSFNPYEYTVSQQNNYKYEPSNKGERKVEFESAGPQTLKLTLVFDAYENGEGKRDVSKVTTELWNLMTPEEYWDGKRKAAPKQNKNKPDAPFVTFEWGVFKFVAVITSMTQKFTLFDHDGVPLRAKVDITFTQHKSEERDYQTISATTPPSIVAKSGERPDIIAANEMGDPAKWRDIAQANNITNPLALRPGQALKIPWS